MISGQRIGQGVHHVALMQRFRMPELDALIHKGQHTRLGRSQRSALASVPHSRCTCSLPALQQLHALPLSYLIDLKAAGIYLIQWLDLGNNKQHWN